MNNFRKITIVTLVAALSSLGNVGCKSGGKAGKEEHPKEYPQKKTEQPKGDHPKH